VQVDAAQHLVVAVRLAQAANGQRKPARRDVRTMPRQPRLFDEIRAIHRFGVRQETKGLLHLYS
jgi:hypothetical protein